MDHVYVDVDTDMMKQLHFILKNNTSDVKNPLTPVGGFKIVGSVIGSLQPINTTDPEDVERELDLLLNNYSNRENIELEDIVDFHVRFEQIHPFADRNGRVGRLIVFK